MKRVITMGFLFCSILLLTSCLAIVHDGGSRWVTLGVQRVSLHMDRDIIRVGHHKGAFQAIRIKVTGSAVHFLDLKVFYENGQVQDIPIRTHIKANQRSPIFDLKGQGRSIARVEMVYRSEPRRRRPRTARVTLYGLRY